MFVSVNSRNREVAAAHQQKRDRIGFLDGLRGLAILMVLMFHAFARWPDVVPYGHRFVENPLFANGWLGVQLFFLISGFVIFMTLEKCKSVADFLFRRWLRLFPAMLICSLIIFTTASFFSERPAGPVAVRDLLPGVTFIEPAWWERMLGSHQGMAEGAFWSLFVEVKFYLVSGFLYFLLGSRATIAALFACFFSLTVANRLLNIVGMDWFLALLGYIDARFYGWFAAGALFFNYYRAGSKWLLLLSCSIAMLAAIVQEGFAWPQKWIPLTVVFVFVSAILFRQVRWLLSQRIMVILGFVSYPLYLLHENMMVSLIVKTNDAFPWMPAILIPIFPISFVVGLAWLVATYAEPRVRALLKSHLGQFVAKTSSLAGFRELVGVFVYDLRRYSAAVDGKDQRYLSLHNRHERLEPAPDGSGYRCEWQWTSDLHAAKVLPFLGRWLMQRALGDHPIRLRAAPERCTASPELSFIIGHRGESRLPHLLKTLESIAGQAEVDFECIVVEQDVLPRLPGRLPEWVRHVHTPPPTPDLPYCRSWAFNVGAKLARGRVLVLHDNDMLVPADYTAEIMHRVAQGFEVINLKRFIFYLTEAHSQAVFAGQASLLDATPEAIIQNLEGGGSVAITRAGYAGIGGMDEAFVGWGGEDNEFWERAETLRVWPWAYLPLVHLWHPAQPGKQSSDTPTLARYRALAAIEPASRIARLREIESGRMSGPVGWHGEVDGAPADGSEQCNGLACP